MKSLLTVCLVLSCIILKAQTANSHKADIVIYGGTSSAIVAAVKAKQLGHSVLVVSPAKHLGGVSSSGLGFTDSGNSKLIGGLSKTFYQKVYDYYQNSKAWNWQSKEAFHGKGQGTSAIDQESKTMWVFEPHVAEHVFDTWVTDNDINVLKDEWLDRNKPIKKNGTAIQSFYTLSGKKIEGQIFIDATYEGDLMAAAGVSYHVGREANSVYNETYNGIQKGVYQHHHNFKKLKISPYIIPKQPESGLVAKVSNQAPGKNGDGDHRVEAYCFRLCLTKEPKNKIPITKPEGYNPKDYELLGRVYKKHWKETFKKFDAIPNLKTDVNNHGPFSMDNIGMNYAYPEASYEERKAIIEEHRRYQEGLLYFTTTDARVPKKIREEMQKWGYAKDEFTDNGGFPHQLYVREARRMIGDYVMTEHNVMGQKDTNASIGIGSYHLDSHNTQRYVTSKGHVENEGDVGVKPPHPYKIDKGTILPKASECSNLIVPVCVSSSHIAYGSIRMEPVFMILGESASEIASLALKHQINVQDVDYTELKPLLLKSGQILENK
ncbi:FAD-dependent oxidoreductase [Pseudotamlana carrageenivorans]|uniref:Xanthan lyase n=1 Tax=Pseudotamlana carrageenivorans TaxID=2069432 RepID=A0A2I7SHG4_9FLAO|nr:FAD-dependent oxidoreductase [Tamlana carrageenivorans]AUS05304.1 xanthan lyase [Tamlana carrageenivorans]